VSVADYELQHVIIKAESETTMTMSGIERRRDGYERLMNNFERFLNQQQTVQERLSNGYRTAVNRVRNGYERLSNRSVPEDKERLLKDDRKKCQANE